MIDVVIDGQRLLPCLPGPREIADGVPRVADVGEDLRLRHAVAVLPAQAERGFEMIISPGKVA